MTDKPIPGHGGWQKPVKPPVGPPPPGLPELNLRDIPLPAGRGCTCYDVVYHPDPNCRECKRDRARFEVGYQ